VIIVLLIIAAARPQWGKKLQILEEKGLDIVVAIDVSTSMLAEDLAPKPNPKSGEFIYDFSRHAHRRRG